MLPQLCECMRKTTLQNKMARVVTPAVGVPEEDVVGKDGAVPPCVLVVDDGLGCSNP